MKVIETGLKWAYGLSPRSTTTNLILHHSGSAQATVSGVHSYHLSKGWAGIGYHYLVRKDGSIYRGRPENMRGGHTSNWNWCSIGICFEGNFEEEKMCDAQLNAGRELIADILSRYPEIEVGEHCQYGLTACPGRNFPPVGTFTEKPQEPVGASPEGDGKPAVWAEQACTWAMENGIVLGDENGSFNWEKPLTKQEMALMLHRYSKLSA